jgi:hypothetical protein
MIPRDFKIEQILLNFCQSTMTHLSKNVCTHLIEVMIISNLAFATLDPFFNFGIIVEDGWNEGLSCDLSEYR